MPRIDGGPARLPLVAILSSEMGGGPSFGEKVDVSAHHDAVSWGCGFGYTPASLSGCTGLNSGFDWAALRDPPWATAGG